jgi:hypothetical protein
MYRTVALAATGFLLAPSFATASDVEAQLNDMEARMSKMEDQLQATTDQLADAQQTVEQQQAVIEESAVAEDRSGALSSLSSFLEATDFDAWAAGSYAYRIRSTDNTDQFPRGKSPQIFGYTNANTFTLDQLWFAIDKAPTEESRGGFHTDIAYGSSTNNIPGTPLFTAYVSWLAPLGNGLQLDGGAMGTLIGAEVVATTDNFNLSRGLVWGLQPVNVVGVNASYEIIDGLSVSARMLNDPLDNSISDLDRSKSFEGNISYSADKFAVIVGGAYGRTSTFSAAGTGILDLQCALANPGAPGACAFSVAFIDGGFAGSLPTTLGLLNAILSADPLDNLSVYADFVWRVNDVQVAYDNTFANPTAPNSILEAKVQDIGISLATRLQVIENTGLALRGEWVQTKIKDYKNFNVAAGTFNLPAPGTIKQWSLTGTVDQALTDHLKATLEYRYDGSDNGLPTLPGNNGGFLLGSNRLDPSFATQTQNHTFIVQMLYQF